MKKNKISIVLPNYMNQFKEKGIPHSNDWEYDRIIRHPKTGKQFRLYYNIKDMWMDWRALVNIKGKTVKIYKSYHS